MLAVATGKHEAVKVLIEKHPERMLKPLQSKIILQSCSPPVP